MKPDMVVCGAASIEEQGVSACVLRVGRFEADYEAALGRVFGASWPNAANSISNGIVLIEPRAWLVLGRSATFVRACAASALAGLHHVADIGPAKRMWRIRGEGASEVLMRGAALDFERFPAASAAQTVLAQIPVLIMRRGREESFEIIADSAYGAHVRCFLRRAHACMSADRSARAERRSARAGFK